ncbi:MAG TPA: UDP-N-acetylglucosamine 2-epimerase (non-hydrolyzing) [Gemmatimonadales bacterium]|nr:UDP-N-acetylglucosamine 2-epimerase (non-hydrolyzing) [Gemmatimonadales bacterium]
MTLNTGAIALFFGTRPQVIKASVLREMLASLGGVAAVDTGQHYDYALHRVHYDQLGVAPPDAYLGVGSGSHGQQTAAILTAAEAWLGQHRPRVAVVIGDTNSTLACALAAAKQRVPIAHVEAGLRATDLLMAEEINRRCVDAIASFLFAPSKRAEETLRRERVDGQVHRVGDVAYDVLKRAMRRAPASPFVDGVYVYATLHRAELVDDPVLLRNVMSALDALPLPVLFAAHPRTTEALRRAGCSPANGIRMRDPLGYLESVAAIRGASAVVTDSGGIQREAYWMGIPCVTVRTETEWIETVECGANRLVPPSASATLAEAVAEALTTRRCGWDVTHYGDGKAAERVAAVLAEGRFGSSSSS